MFSVNALQAQNQHTISGTISSGGEPVAFANVGIPSLNKGVSTNEDGYFELKNIPEGRFELKVSAVGFIELKKEIVVHDTAELYLEFELRRSITELDQIVVTGTLKETTIKDSPVKVQWVSGETLNKSSSNNLMDGVKYINGLYSQVECAVCGTSNIRINGMEGPYTSVLIDGMPVMGALASVYGLSGINSDIIQNLEIIKGPNSTLYGSQAMGGVINIITKYPDQAPLFSVHTNTNSHSEHNFNLSYNPELENSETLFSSTLYHSGAFIDENNDGFGDLTQDTRFTFFNKWNLKREDFNKTSFATKLYLEKRRGGVENYDHTLRGSDTVYGESIYTNRFELMGSHDFPLEKADLKLDASYAYHNQDSYYGDYHYQADQHIFYSHLIWNQPLFEDGDLLSGLAVKYDALDQLFNTMTLEGGSKESRFVPGIFLQYDHRWNNSLQSLAGLRADHHLEHGVILSPRLNLKVKPGSHTTFRLNMGTGFRIVNLFTEEHEALTGGREVQIAEKLNPEESFNLALNLNQIIDIGESSILNTDFDIFYTRFSNQIIPDYSTPNQIIYTNLNGYSISRGISLSMAHNFIAPLTYMVGFTLQDVYSVEEDIKEDILFSPDFTMVFSLSYVLEKYQLAFDYTGRVNGRVKLPEYSGRDEISEIFSEQNLKVSKAFNNGIQLYVTGKNIFNYTQPSPLIAPGEPFSDEFATDYVFGPVQGRRIEVGISLAID